MSDTSDQRRYYERMMDEIAEEHRRAIAELEAENAKLRELEGHIAESESIIDTLDAVVEGYIAQKKRIAELEAENRRQSADLYATAGANDKLEALVLDMYCQLLNAYDAKELDGFAERMRELGIGVEE